VTEQRIHRLLEDLTGKPAQLHFKALHDLLVAKLRGNGPAAQDARQKLEEVTRDTMGAAEVLGASVTLAAAGRRGAKFARDPDPGILPNVTFEEGLSDMVTRAPVTIRNAAERTARAISRLYSEGRHLAFVRAAEDSVTNAASDILRRAIEDGLAENQVGTRLSIGVEEVRKLSKPWAESYSRLVFRTNLNTAITAGRFRQAADPDIRSIMPAFRFDSVGDVDTRHNHRAAHGLVMAVNDPRWAQLAPPLGYNCRCQVIPVDVATLEDDGMLDENGAVRFMAAPPEAQPDKGFRHGGRPDLMGVA
jgi:SPP1 gp7 family putative phage head morphogenesis protein